MWGKALLGQLGGEGKDHIDDIEIYDEKMFSFVILLNMKLYTTVIDHLQNLFQLNR